MTLGLGDVFVLPDTLASMHNEDILMLSFLFFFACTHTQAVWESSPRPVVATPLARVSVVSSDKRCQDFADALAIEFSMRPGVVVVPRGDTRLLLNLCRLQLSTEIDISQVYTGGSASVLEQRNQAVRGHGQAVLTIEVNGQPIGMVNSEASRVRLIRAGDPAHLHRRSNIRERVVSDIAEDLAQQLVPIPERIRRLWYRNPEPGTAKAMHNQAVDAERSGNLAEAIRLATEAVNAARNPVSVAYLRALEARRSSSHFVEKL